MKVKQILRLMVSCLLAFLFVWLITRHITISDLRRAFAGTTTAWIICSLFAYSTGYSCRIERWRLMLNRDNASLRWRDCAGPLMGGFAANNVLPFRAGDVLRAVAFKGRLGVSSGVVVATLFVERLLDLLMVIVLLGAALAVFGLDAGRFAGVGSVVLIALGAFVLLLLLFPQSFSPIAKGLGKLVAHATPKFGVVLAAEIEKSLTTLAHLAKGNTMIRLIAWSLAAWMAEGCVFWSSALALTSIKVPLAGWLALPVGTLATLIPSTPGYVGTFDYFIVRAMTALHNDIMASTAYALLVHVLLWLPATTIGGVYLLLRPTRAKITVN